MEVIFWIGNIIIGIATAAAAFFAARSGARQSMDDRTQRDEAAQREEWFRRMQWATDLTLRPDNDDANAAGFSILKELSVSKLATADDRKLIAAIGDEPELDAHERTVEVSELDDTTFVDDDQDNDGGPQ